MRRPSGKVLGALTVALLLVQAFLVPPMPERLDPADEFFSLDLFLGLFVPLFFAAGGRVLLAYLPPGDVGGHDPRALPVTLAASAVLGCLAFGSLEGLVPGGYYPVYAGVLVLALLRRATLPGAMVPRHAVAREPAGRIVRLLPVAGVAWAAWLGLSEDGVPGLLWLALGVLLFHGLGVARRRRAGRYAVLGAMALTFAGFAPEASLEGLAPALSLGLGATFLLGWLRRADRRAGALAGIGFGSAFLAGLEPLALAGALVFVLASRPRQRPFALAWVGGAGALALLVAILARGLLPEPRGRLLLADEMGLELERWGLAWPALLAALVLGGLTFEGRGAEWRPGAIEEPRVEARALGALLAASMAALAVPFSPWFECQVLVILFPPCALLAGLLLIPPEPVPAES